MTFAFETFFPTLLIFARFAAALSFFPGLKGQSVPAVLKVSFALILALLLTPMLESKISAPVLTELTIVLSISAEVLAGIFMGYLFQVLFLTVDTAGQLLSFQIGLSSAQMFDPGTGQQSSLVSRFLILMATVLVFSTDLHVYMLEALIRSYDILIFKESYLLSDMAILALKFVAQSFNLAIHLALPVTMVITLYFLSLGVVSKFVPGVQIYFISLPGQILLGLFLFSVNLAGLINVFGQEFKHMLENLTKVTFTG